MTSCAVESAFFAGVALPARPRSAEDSRRAIVRQTAVLELAGYQSAEKLVVRRRLTVERSRRIHLGGAEMPAGGAYHRAERPRKTSGHGSVGTATAKI